MSYKKYNKMNPRSFKSPFQHVLRGMLPFLICLIFGTTGYPAEQVNPLLREFPITVNPSALNPPTWWHVPGVTPLIWTKDPINMDAYKTTEAKELKLKPGEYRFGTFTFDFLFKVSLAGTLEYSSALDQCVDGRGTQVLTIRCSHTQPYPQEPDYGK